MWINFTSTKSVLFDKHVHTVLVKFLFVDGAPIHQTNGAENFKIVSLNFQFLHQLSKFEPKIASLVAYYYTSLETIVNTFI